MIFNIFYKKEKKTNTEIKCSNYIVKNEMKIKEMNYE